MPLIYFSPSWFYGYDVALELVFAIIALILARFALKVSRITGEPKTKLFGTSFLLISLAYFIQSAFNFLILSKLNERVCRAAGLSVASLDFLGAYLHMIFMLSGLIVLLYMTFHKKMNVLLYSMLALGAGALAFGGNSFFTFYLLSTICLLFIAAHFVRNYLKNKQKLTLLVATAFVFLLFGSLHFFLSVNHQTFYALGHILELLAYALIWVNFILVQRK